MIWRFARRSPRFPSPRLPPVQNDSLGRHLSTISASDPSIATILARPPAKGSLPVTAVGSVRTVRKQKRHAFVELGDGSTSQSLQAILKPSQAEGYALIVANQRMLLANGSEWTA